MFQSTHPAWGVTADQVKIVVYSEVSIHTPRVGCDPEKRFTIGFDAVSIHTPRVGCDGWRPALYIFWYVSIHTPRVGCDLYVSRLSARFVRFNPHTPRGV